MEKGLDAAINVLTGWINGGVGIISSIVNFVVSTVLLPLDFLSALLS